MTTQPKTRQVGHEFSDVYGLSEVFNLATSGCSIMSLPFGMTQKSQNGAVKVVDFK
jgi:hypothetical protein